jgi:hypothetical protein
MEKHNELTKIIDDDSIKSTSIGEYAKNILKKIKESNKILVDNDTKLNDTKLMVQTPCPSCPVEKVCNVCPPEKKCNKTTTNNIIIAHHLTIVLFIIVIIIVLIVIFIDDKPNSLNSSKSQSTSARTPDASLDI